METLVEGSGILPYLSSAYRRGAKIRVIAWLKARYLAVKAVDIEITYERANVLTLNNIPIGLGIPSEVINWISNFLFGKLPMGARSTMVPGGLPQDDVSNPLREN